MSGHIEIAAALNTRMTAAAPGAAIDTARIKRENLDPVGTDGQTHPFTPPTTGLWYRVFCILGEAYAAGIGEQARNRIPGIYQIDVMGPAGKGTKATDDEAERIRKCFARGTALTYSGVVVQIEKAWVQRSSTQDDAAYFRQIVRVQWTADVEN